MSSQNHNVRSRLYRKLLVFSLVIAIVPIWIGSIVHVRTLRALSTASAAVREQTLHSASRIADETMGDVDSLTEQILTNDRVRRYSTVEDAGRNVHVYDAYEIIRDFGQYKRLGGFADEFYVYFPTSETVLTSTGKHDSDLFFNSIFTTDGMTIGEWRSDLLSHTFRPSFGLLRTRSVTVSGERGDSYYSYVRAMSVNSSQSAEIVAVVLIREETFRNFLVGMAGNGWAYVTDASGLPIGASHDSAPPLVESLSDRRYTVTSQPSAFPGWTYHALTRREPLLTLLGGTFSVAIGLTIVGLIASFMLARRMAQSSYNLIRSTTETLARYTGDDTVSIRDELSYLSSVVSETIENDRLIQFELSSHSHQMRAHFLERLLRGQISDSIEIRSGLAYHGIRTHSDQFVVVVIADESEDPRVDLDFGSGCEDGALAGVELPDRMTAIILNPHELAPAEQLKEYVRSMIRSRSIGANSRRLRAGFSDLHSGLARIHGAYVEADDALRYSRIRSAEAFVEYGDISGADIDFHFPIEIQRRLVSSALAADIQGVDAMMKEVYRQNFETRRLSLAAMEILLFELTGTAIRAVRRVGSLARYGLRRRFHLLQSSSSVPEVFTAVRRVFAEICESVDGAMCSHNEVLRDQIERFVEEHFANEGFSQTMMAEALGLSAPHLSRVFREWFGESMVDYVCRRRVERAKEIFATDSSQSVSLVAAQVGCYSDRALIRIFKKYVGVTPGRFRNALAVTGGEE